MRERSSKKPSRMSDPKTALSIALYFSVPPVAAVVLSNILVVDKTFAIAKLLGSRLPHRALSAARCAFHLAHACMHVGMVVGVVSNCEISNYSFPVHGDYGATDKCFPSVAAAALLRICLLWARQRQRVARPETVAA